MQQIQGFKFIKSLIGIETRVLSINMFMRTKIQIHQIPNRDWNPVKIRSQVIGEWFKFIKSLIGIETREYRNLEYWQGGRFKFIKSLIGIETS